MSYYKKQSFSWYQGYNCYFVARVTDSGRCVSLGESLIYCMWKRWMLPSDQTQTDVLLCVSQGALAAEEKGGDKDTCCLRGLQYVYEWQYISYKVKYYRQHLNIKIK
jgi:hypothetical protein